MRQVHAQTPGAKQTENRTCHRAHRPMCWVLGGRGQSSSRCIHVGCMCNPYAVVMPLQLCRCRARSSGVCFGCCNANTTIISNQPKQDLVLFSLSSAFSMHPRTNWKPSKHCPRTAARIVANNELHAHTISSGTWHVVNNKRPAASLLAACVHTRTCLHATAETKTCVNRSVQTRNNGRAALGQSTRWLQLLHLFG